MRWVAALLLLAAPAYGRTLSAGAGQEYPSPSAAAAAAQDGDTIQIAPGTYFDCIATDKRLTIQGPATLTDKPCEGKALLVLKGDGSVVRDLVLARARVSDGNGAGIRLEGRNLTIDRVQFDNNEAALIGGAGRITLTDCTITAGQAGFTAVLIGAAEQLTLTNTRISVAHGLAISSGAALTMINGGAIETADRGIELAGPAVVQDMVVTLRPGAAPVAIRTVTGGITIGRVRLVNETGAPAALLLDWGSGQPRLDAITVGRGDQPVTTAGNLRYQAGNAWRTGKSTVRDAARAAKHAIVGP